VLDVFLAEDDESRIEFQTLDASYIKLRVRNRITADGGKSIMASDKMSMLESFDEFELDESDPTMRTASTLGKTAAASVDINNERYPPKGRSKSAGFTKGTSFIRQNQPTPLPFRPDTKKLKPPPNPQPRPTHAPPGNSTSVQKQSGSLLPAACKKALRDAAISLWNERSDPTYFVKVQMAAEKALLLPRDFFNSVTWATRSRNIIQDEMVSRTKDSQFKLIKSPEPDEKANATSKD
jgi:hypothetical protein